MYKINVNTTDTFKLSKDTLKALDSVEISSDTYHILHENTSIKAKVLKSDFNKKTFKIKVNNNTYNVDIQDQLDQQIEALGFEIGASRQVNDIKAPMPGLILEITVKVGDYVKENDTLLILEAMKMENVIHSPREGIIKSIKVNERETVEKNTLLIEFES
ncbi:acetyl-CoA carboxylase biotin carboxyl carrier protein subunit [Winogradskyella endarachnes]|uniref:Biotin/lipoyl-binding protein n=1 Tax=Winogradskyella endarachnes TaxID=2681965 RepID=A0A6L6U8E2_9FLAO|nr:acetyl-CoA carboxylase biotin carboxyl carrier protein subunit [Winogradskyella endarachnes]MUU78438.1 biotin/lipoyl-binding protein [Winogradskyella endarachnes]